MAFSFSFAQRFQLAALPLRQVIAIVRSFPTGRYGSAYLASACIARIAYKPATAGDKSAPAPETFSRSTPFPKFETCAASNVSLILRAVALRVL